MTVSIKEVDRSTWISSASLFKDYNFRQLWDYGILSAKRVGAESLHLEIRENDAVLGYADVRIKLIPLLGFGIAYINGGPLVRKGDADDEKRLGSCLAVLKEEFVSKRGLLLRINSLELTADWKQISNISYLKAGFSIAKFPQYRTLVVDISKSLNDVRMQFHQKWRSCLNGSEKKNITISEGVSIDLFEKFNKLFDMLVKRKNFSVDQDGEFFLKVQKHLSDNEKFRIIIAEKDGQILAGHISSIQGDTCVYLLGASSEAGLREKASYLLQWKAITHAKEAGCLFYDLGGIDPDNNPGVYRFKNGLGGIDIFSPTYEAWSGFLKRFIIVAAEQLYKKIKK
jgi:lipid II:glycine glycyltransferase (peptidoglycan interpeptide bridge formation enzyme)